MKDFHQFIQSASLADLAVAIGDQTSNEELLEHAESCTECASRIREARRVYGLLSDREKIEAEPQ